MSLGAKMEGARGECTWKIFFFSFRLKKASKEKKNTKKLVCTNRRGAINLCSSAASQEVPNTRARKGKLDTQTRVSQLAFFFARKGEVVQLHSRRHRFHFANKQTAFSLFGFANPEATAWFVFPHRVVVQTRALPSD